MSDRRIYTMGALVRRDFRRLLDRSNLSYREDKGWLDSQFIVTGDASTLAALDRVIVKVLGNEAPA